MRVRALLFPDPPRRIPRHRALGLTLRTAHLMTFGALLGGHFFDVDPARLMPFLVATIASGGALLALELSSTCAWLFMGKGLVVLAKLIILLMVPFFWEHRVFLLLLTVAVASVGSHMPSRFRHRCFLPALQQSRSPSPELSSERSTS
ncbi:MAG: hypothetical protein Q8P98_05740 [Candidatus Rokubacteria bacterium]|nr:hypothetical protein [Candidatus Rokubacteria bacterium]